MAIKLTDFVNVHITRDTVMYYERNKTVAYLSDTVVPDPNKIGGALVYNSLLEIKNVKDTLGTRVYYQEDNNGVITLESDVYKACKVFFDCGGRSVLLVNVPTPTLSEGKGSYNNYLDTIKTLPLEVIAFSTKIGKPTPSYNGGLLLEERLNILNYLDTIETGEGTAYRKLVAWDITSVTDIIVNNESVNTLLKLVKYGVSIGDIDVNYEYSCMSILAHLSRIDLNNSASISDYCFTRETTLLPVENSMSWTDVNKNINVVLDVFGGIPTNFGGNTGGGTSILEEYMTIFISQDILLTEVRLLQTKLRAETAITKVHSALINVLEVYFNLGFLIQDVYTGEDIFINKNGINYKVLSSGDIITGGYLVNILPINSRSQAEIVNNSLPDIHLILNTVKGIKKMNNIGRII